MALANEILSPGFNSILHKLLNMKEGAPSPQLSPEIMAAIVLEADRPEYAFLSGGRLCAGFVSSAAAAGLRSACILRNSVGSNVLAVVEYALAFGTGAQPVYTGLVITGGTVATTLWSRDLRDGSKPTCILVGNNTLNHAGVTAGAHQLGIARPYLAAFGGSDYSEWLWPVVLRDGTSFGFEQGGDNQLQAALFVWRERTFEASEAR